MSALTGYKLNKIKTFAICIEIMRFHLTIFFIYIFSNFIRRKLILKW